MAEGGGGVCHYVTEYAGLKYGWARVGVAILTLHGEVSHASFLFFQ
jgi:hypothetical protein